MSFTESLAGSFSRAVIKTSRTPLILLTGLVLVIASRMFGDNLSLFVLAIGASILVLGVSFEMLVYLQETRRRFIRDRAFAERQSARTSYPPLDTQIQELTRDVSQLKSSITGNIIQEDEREAIKAKIITKVEQDLIGSAGADLLAKLHISAAADQHTTAIRNIVLKTQERLSEEVNALGSRANVNLFLGILISLCGLTVLGYFVFSIPSDLLLHGKELEFIGYFTTRLSLVIFIEIFAYFFLRLYRYSIFEIKYFQNEMTNAEFRVMALEAALMSGDKSTIKKLCEDLSKTERNFLLKKGETTINQKSLENEYERDQSLVSTIENLAKVFSQRERSEAKKPATASH
jgi:hypothetical protein